MSCFVETNFIIFGILILLNSVEDAIFGLLFSFENRLSRGPPRRLRKFLSLFRAMFAQTFLQKAFFKSFIVT